MSTKVECGTCGYKWSRPANEQGRKECPKCQTPLANPRGRAPGEVSTIKQSAGSAMQSESGKCKKNNGGPHQFKFGKCSLCGIGEGKFNKGPGAAANPGGEGGCSKGGKCVFQFAKCKKCGRSELGGAPPAKSPKSPNKSPVAKKSAKAKAAPASTNVEEDLGLSPKVERQVSSGRRSPRPSGQTLGAPAAGGTTSTSDLAKRTASEFKEVKAALEGINITCKSLEVGSDVEIKLCYNGAGGPLTEAAIDEALGQFDSLTGKSVVKALKNAASTASAMEGFVLADVHVNMSNSACHRCCFKSA